MAKSDSNVVAFVSVVSWDVSVPVTNLPARYSDFLDVFEKRNADRLPAHRPVKSLLLINRPNQVKRKKIDWIEELVPPDHPRAMI